MVMIIVIIEIRFRVVVVLVPFLVVWCIGTVHASTYVDRQLRAERHHKAEQKKKIAIVTLYRFSVAKRMNQLALQLRRRKSIQTDAAADRVAKYAASSVQLHSQHREFSVAVPLHFLFSFRCVQRSHTYTHTIMPVESTGQFASRCIVLIKKSNRPHNENEFPCFHFIRRFLRADEKKNNVINYGELKRFAV